MADNSRPVVISGAETLSSSSSAHETPGGQYLLASHASSPFKLKMKVNHLHLSHSELFVKLQFGVVHLFE